MLNHVRHYVYLSRSPLQEIRATTHLSGLGGIHPLYSAESASQPGAYSHPFTALQATDVASSFLR